MGLESIGFSHLAQLSCQALILALAHLKLMNSKSAVGPCQRHLALEDRQDDAIG